MLIAKALFIDSDTYGLFYFIITKNVGNVNLRDEKCHREKTEKMPFFEKNHRNVNRFIKEDSLYR